jgi:hypothetical protein
MPFDGRSLYRPARANIINPQKKASMIARTIDAMTSAASRHTGLAFWSQPSARLIAPAPIDARMPKQDCNEEVVGRAPPMNKLAMLPANRPRIIVESTRPYNMQSPE